MHTQHNFIAFDEDGENNKGKGEALEDKWKCNSEEEEHDIRAELEAFYTMLLEAFKEVDLELAGVATVEKLGSILDDLHEDGAIDYYDQNDLQLLANDMDSEGGTHKHTTHTHTHAHKRVKETEREHIVLILQHTRTHTHIHTHSRDYDMC